MSTLLLRCLTGSRLYGTVLDEKTADYDYIEVYDKLVKSKHSIKDDQDVQKWSLSTLMKIAWAGGHNAHDVMWAPRGWCEPDLLTDMRLGFRVDPYIAWPRYNKTIESCYARGDRKGRLHAYRLEFNYALISIQGWYDPTLFAQRYDWRSIK